MSGSHAPRYRPILLSVAAILLAPSLALAQSRGSAQQVTSL